MDLTSQGLQPVTMGHSIVQMLDTLQRIFRPAGSMMESVSVTLHYDSAQLTALILAL